MYTEHGDLGDVAQACRQTQVRLSTTGHTLLQVYPAGSPMPLLALSQSSCASLQHEWVTSCANNEVSCS